MRKERHNMSMTKEEAITILQHLAAIVSSEDYQETFKMAASALRPITREQVERMWKGEWIAYLDGEHIMPERYYSCSKCGGRGHLSKRNFCDFCGAPMTDKAVDMVMERLEALGYGKDD